MRQAVFGLLASITLVLALLVTRSRAQAGGVVTNCGNDTDLSNNLAGAGDITFNCGTATITLTSTKTVSADTTIDGGGTITLSGGDARRLFLVNGGATLTLRNIVLTNGYAADDGGAISNHSYLVLDGATIQHSQTDPGHSGGAISTYGPVEMRDSVLDHNSAGNGGAIFARLGHANITITGGYLTNNSTTNVTNGWGGAVLLWDGATLSVTGADMADNYARYGGAIDNPFQDSTLEIARTLFVRNHATLSGGAIYDKGGFGPFLPDQLTESTLQGNDAGVSGGAVQVGENGSFRFERVTATDNTAPYGGAVSNEGEFDAYTSTISGNNSASDGAGLYAAGFSDLYDVTFAGNYGSGAALTGTSVPNTSLTLIGVLMDSASGLANCSFSRPPEIDPSNLSSDNTCNFGAGRDGIDPLIGPLTDNGGPTWTHMLMANSPAIDFAAAACEGLDQRGAPRPSGAACDVGAVEYGSSIPTPTPNATPTPTPSPPHTPTPSPTPTHTPTPTPVPTPTHSPTPTPIGSPLGLIQGDVDCNHNVSAVDALKQLRHVASLSVSQTQPCPPIGDDAGGHPFGDVDCDGNVSAVDALKDLRSIAGLSVAQQGQCVHIGDPLG